ncbi:MotB family protein [Rhodopseudomonas boonkerdii]|uniref:MotB family protein n=1 Tax=Rhodopseudomonas boonkerdii TaxID=475937 RepID=UPI001E513634|nr:MotB family protein [Rhodopseudomonas boonkerdii]UGV28700.1 MotB family protein [Rhodopseudomonas boonkerdii]
MADQQPTEILIIRRRSSLDASETKNSVWKIAYADFMTAMMAFFLVMWLINVTSQEARESVATYFNPIKLTDSTPDRKGVNDARRVDPGKATEGNIKSPLPEPGQPTTDVVQPQPPQPRYGEATLFRDPYAVLTEIAGGPPRTGQTSGALDQTRREGLKGGEAYRDPFDPINWPMASISSLERMPAGRKDAGSLPYGEDIATVTEGQEPRPADPKPDATGTLVQETAGTSSTPPKSEKLDPPKPVGLFSDDVAKPNAVADMKLSAAEKPPAKTDKPQAQVEKTTQTDAAKLQSTISAALATLGAVHPVAEVRETPEGLLVNLTDDANYGMFANGSAEPTPGLVRTLDKITPMIAQNRGQVIVRGHTDARVFRTAEYDNWRLSTARAHMAYHMLVRGGLDAARVERIEGYADRRLKDQSDPLAAQNRRIEILIRAPTL